MIYRQHMYSVGIYKTSFVRIFLSSFSACANAFLYIPTMYLYCVYPAISKHTKNLPNSTKKTRYKVVLIVFNGVPCDVNVYTVTVSYSCTVRITYQKKTISWFMMIIFMHSKNWSSQCNLTARIEPGQDNCFTMVPSVLIARNK